MDKVTLTTVHNAFDRSGRDIVVLDQGLTLGEIVAQHLPQSVDFALSVNGQVVSADDFALVPRSGDMITAVPVVTGGSNSGKMIGRLIAMIIVAVVASYAAPALAAAFGGTSAAAIGVASGAIMMVGGLLVNMAFAVSPPSGGNLPTFGDNATDSPSYSWAPQSTQQQGIVIPKWYGKNKLYGNIIMAHITNNGNDSYVNALIHLGFGPFSRIYDFSINDQSIDKFIGINTPEISYGNLYQSDLTSFEGSTVEYSLSRLVAYGTPVVYETPSDSFDSMEVVLQFPRGLGHYTDTGSLTALSVHYRVSYRKLGDVDWINATTKYYSYTTLGFGYWSRGYYNPNGYVAGTEDWAAPTWVELEAGSSDPAAHRYGDLVTPASHPGEQWIWIAEPAPAGGSFYDYHVVYGHQTSPLRIAVPINIITPGRYEIKVERLTADFTSTRDFGELYLSALKETITESFQYPRQVLVGLRALATNQLSGSLRFSCMADCCMVRVFDGTGWQVKYSTNPAWICYDILTQPVLTLNNYYWDFENDKQGWTATGGTLTVDSDNLVLVSDTLNYATFWKSELSLDGSGLFLVKVRVKRTSGPATVPGGSHMRLYYQTPLSTYMHYCYLAENTPLNEYTTLTFDMRTIGAGDPDGEWISNTIIGLQMRMSVYSYTIDSIGIYDSDVDGVIRYDGIDPSRIDHASFKTWADYCDELLDDGAGGTEKRIEFNGGFDSEMTLWEAVLRVCSTAYAAPIWNGTRLSISIDKPADPVQLFSLGNIDQDSFRETFLPMEDRAAEIEVDFVNEEREYQRDKLTVINTNMTTVTSKVSMSLFGITKPSMAWRAAMRKLAYNQHISRTIEFGADIDAIACTVGDVILVQHDVPQWGYGGRIVAATTTQITIDQTITLEVGVQYAILVRMDDDTLIERDITNAPGDASVLAVSPAFSTAPQQFDVYSVGEILKTAKPFRVSNIERSGELKAKISAVEYVAAVYDVDYTTPATAVINYSQTLTNYKQALPPFEVVVSAAVSERLTKTSGGQVLTLATITWTKPVNQYAFPSAAVYAWQDGAPPALITPAPVNTGSFEWTVPVDGVYWNFAVALVNLNGEIQPISQLVPVRSFIKGKTTPPEDITNFHVTPIISGGLRFSWSGVSDIDVSEYVIRHSPLLTAASWYGATEIIRSSALYANLNIALSGTYFIKALDTTGNYSDVPSSVVVSAILAQIALTNHAVITEQPAWAGSGLYMSESGGELKVDNTGGAPDDPYQPKQITGQYVVSQEVNFDQPTTVRISAQCDWIAEAGSIWDVDSIWAMADFWGPTGKSWVQIYISTSQDASAPANPQPLFAGDYTFQRAVFEIKAFRQYPDTVKVKALTITIDNHDTVITI